MKKMSLALRIFSGILVSILALVFTVFETTLLITLDFTLYENELIAFIQLLLKVFIAVYALAVGIFSLFKRSRSFLTESLCLFMSSLVMIPFVSNNFGIYFTAVSFVFILTVNTFILIFSFVCFLIPLKHKINLTHFFLSM